MISPFLALLLATAPKPAHNKPAAAPAPAAEKPPEPEFHWKPGPATLPLGHALTMDLPADDVFLAPPEAGKLMEKLGNLHNENLMGLVMGKDEQKNWIVTIRYSEEGYVADDEKLDADNLFKTIKDGTEEANEERKQKGFPALHIKNWTEEPRYEKDVHHVVWGLLAQSESADDPGTVNFNTRILGRKGFAALNLLTTPDQIEADKPAVASLLSVTSFDSGSRYEDFDKKTDKKAEYGLAGLILGGGGLMAAAKIGLFAKAGKIILALILAGKKLIILAVAGAAAAFKRLFGKKDGSLPAPPPPGT